MERCSNHYKIIMTEHNSFAFDVINRLGESNEIGYIHELSLMFRIAFKCVDIEIYANISKMC